MAYVVTDLTLMSNDNVCLACLEEEQLSCVRPLFRPSDYNKIPWYTHRGITQGSKLKLKLSRAACSDPHTEDARCTALKTLEKLSEARMQNLLEASCCSSVEKGFGSTPKRGESYFRHDCELPGLSIITLKITPGNIALNQNSFKQGRIKVNLTDDDKFKLFWIPMTDLRYINVAERDFRELQKSLYRSGVVYVRIGLTRQFCSPSNKNGYWLQVNGLYYY